MSITIKDDDYEDTMEVLSDTSSVLIDSDESENDNDDNASHVSIVLDSSDEEVTEIYDTKLLIEKESFVPESASESSVNSKLNKTTQTEETNISIEPNQTDDDVTLENLDTTNNEKVVNHFAIANLLESSNLSSLSTINNEISNADCSEANLEINSNGSNSIANSDFNINERDDIVASSSPIINQDESNENRIDSIQSNASTTDDNFNSTNNNYGDNPIQRFNQFEINNAQSSRRVHRWRQQTRTSRNYRIQPYQRYSNFPNNNYVNQGQNQQFNNRLPHGHGRFWRVQSYTRQFKQRLFHGFLRFMDYVFQPNQQNLNNNSNY